MEMPVPKPTATGAGPQIHPGDVTVSKEVIVVCEFKWILSQVLYNRLIWPIGLYTQENPSVNEYFVLVSCQIIYLAILYGWRDTSCIYFIKIYLKKIRPKGGFCSISSYTWYTIKKYMTMSIRITISFIDIFI